jgi:hypothetical protein
MSNRYSHINASWRPLVAILAVLGLSIAPGGFAGVAAAATAPVPAPIVVYDPTPIPVQLCSGAARRSRFHGDECLTGRDAR